MRYSLIVAMSKNCVIGRAGGLPWRLSADLRRFKRLTMGHHIIMGRKTYESIGRPLPGRTSVVVTRDVDYQPNTPVAELAQSFDGQPQQVLVALSIDDAKRLAAGDDEVFFIGGGEIYRQVLPLVDRIYMTAVRAEIAGDTYFPELDCSHWRLVETVQGQVDEKNEYDHAFLTYDRVRHD
jgi:dihydrofolate reductase